MFTGFFKTIYIFYRLSIYYSRSFQKKNQSQHSIQLLKQQFSIEALSTLGFKIKTSGSPSHEKKLIMVGNHISYLDILVLLAVDPQTVFLAKSEVKNWPLIGPVAQRIGTLFVVRDSKKSRQETKHQIEKILSSDINALHIAAFPSGTTTLSEEKPWKKGLFEIAQNTRVAIQPFRVTYSHPRECAYIDDDQLFSSLMDLFSIKNKMIYFSWGKPFHPRAIETEIDDTRLWTQCPIDTYQFH